MVSPDRNLLPMGIGVVFSEPPRRPPVPASASGGRRPPEWPPTGLMDVPDKPEERYSPELLGEGGYRDLLRLWRRSPQSTDMPLHSVLMGTSLSVYAIATLELIAESQWARRRSPDRVVSLRAKSLEEHVMGVFCSPIPDLELETSFFRIASTNPNRCLGTGIGLSATLALWDAWINQTGRQGTSR